jgi:hypothetical protein
MITAVAHVTINDRQLVSACRRAAFRGMDLASRILLREYKTRLGTGNRSGAAPSLPGEPPKRGTGSGIRALRVVPDRINMRLSLVVYPQGRHLLFLGAGTRPYRIRARGDKLLKIWFRPIPFRGPTREEIRQLGLKRIGSRWYYFRREVRHPGVRQRPWIMPGFFAARGAMVAALRSARP